MKKRYQAIIVATSLLCAGCGDFLSEYSQDMTVPKKVSDLDEVLLGEAYLKSYVVSNGPSQSYVGGFFNILDDDVNTARCIDVNMSTLNRVYAYSISPSFGYFAWQLEVGRNYNLSTADDARNWDNLYARINTVNMILEEIKDLPHELEQDAKDYLRVQGECHFARGQFYFTLANLYGDAYSPKDCATKLAVPLKLTHYVEHDKTKPTQFHRATVKEVYDKVVQDLLLAEKYLTESPQNSHRLHRASAEAASLLLSRVYLYKQDWENAEKKADAVINSTNFNLSTLSSLTSSTVFLSEQNGEIIFSQGSNFFARPSVMIGAGADYCVTQDLYKLYDLEKDRRAKSFFIYNTVTDSIGLANKYERVQDTQTHISDVFMLRKAEAYLIKAEACAMQNGKEKEANRLLNLLRRNRIDDYVDQTYAGEELVKQIRDERRKELCFEGHRWFDLRRYAVCEKYPYSRNIVHVLNVHDTNTNKFVTTVSYALPAGDPAYTFQIPKSVLEFDAVPMPSNPRAARPALKSEEKNPEK